MATVTRFVRVMSYHSFRHYTVPDDVKAEFEWLCEECYLNRWNLRYVQTTELHAPTDKASTPICLSINGFIFSGRQPRARFLIDRDTVGHLAVHVTMCRLRGWSRFHNMYCICDLVTGVCGFSLYQLFQARTLDEADAGYGQRISDDVRFQSCMARLACAMATHPRLGGMSLLSSIDADLLCSILMTVSYELDWSEEKNN